jgi:transcriptional regulator with XRE-family HTH domain
MANMTMKYLSLSHMVFYNRRQRDLTLDQLAKLVGTTKSHIWTIEHSCVGISLTLAARLSVALNIPLDEIAQQALTDEATNATTRRQRVHDA